MYLFKTSEFGIDRIGIYLLRGGYNYRTIYFAEINEIIIHRGKELNNWLVIFFAGIILLVLGLYLSFGALYSLASGFTNYYYLAPRHARLILILFIPVCGGYFIYESLKTGIIMKLNYSNKSKNLLLKELAKANELDEFIDLLENIFSNKLKIELDRRK